MAPITCHLTLKFPGHVKLVQECMKGKEDSEKAGLKLNIQKTKIMSPGPITS